MDSPSRFKWWHGEGDMILLGVRWYLRARYRPRTSWEFDGGLRLDDDDFDTIWTVNLAARYLF